MRRATYRLVPSKGVCLQDKEDQKSSKTMRSGTRGQGFVTRRCEGEGTRLHTEERPNVEEQAVGLMKVLCWVVVAAVLTLISRG